MNLLHLHGVLELMLMELIWKREIACHMYITGTSFWLIAGDAECRHVVIVDDLIKTGGTIIECGKVNNVYHVH